MARLTRGRKALVPDIEISDVRMLTRAELSVLAKPRPPRSLQTLRDSHHRLARAIAAGLRDDEVADLCGYTANRIRLLKADPAFAELVAHYRAIVTAEFVRAADPVIDYMRNNALKAQVMLSDKLDDAAEKDEFLPTRDLLGIAELGLDRTGYGKVNKNVNVNVDFAAHLEAARKRSASARSPQSIEAVSAPRTQSQSPQDGGEALHSDHPVASFRRL